MGKSGDGSVRFLYFAAFTTSLTTFGTGACFGWTSPFLPKFLSGNSEINPVGRPVTTSESAWIVSAMNLGMITAPPISILCLKFYTKKTVLLISMAPIALAHLICIFAYEVIIFILARLLMGVGTGVAWAVLGTYIGEISEDRNRGILGCIPGIMSNLGSLFAYIIGPYLPMRLFSIIILIPLLLFYMGFGYFVPDSPYDLLMKSKHSQAENSLKILRRNNDVEKELKFMKETVSSGSINEVHSRDLIKDRGLRKGLIISLALMTFQQLSGRIAVVSYAEIIFMSAGNFNSSAISTIILGIVSTLGIISSIFLIDRMGRKILLTSSCILQSISLFALGSYFYRLNSNLDVSFISWVPISSLIVDMVSYNFALAMVPWIVTGEIFHSNVKVLASTITVLTNYTLSFILTMCFPYMIQYIGMEWTFWLFALCMVFGSIFCIVILPETKGKNFQEIQKILSSS